MRAVTWGDGCRERFVEWIDHEATTAIGARAGLERRWRTWLEMYRAPADQPLKRFPFEGAPLARDTEILTKTGWRRIDAIRIGEDVLTRRDTDGALEWHPVEALPQRYAEKLYHFKSRSIDLMVTPEHVMVCEAQRSGKVSRIPARDLWGKTGYFLPQHGLWLDGKEHKALWGRDAEAVAEFIGWYLAEGSAQSKPNGNRTALSIAQSESAKPENRERLRTIFQRCGFTWTEYPNAFTVHKSSVPVPLFDLLAYGGLCDKKRIPAVCWSWSANLLDRLLTGMVFGDGNIYDDYPMDTLPKVVYYTTSRGLADDVQVLSALVGLHARVRSRSRVGAGGTMEDGRKIEGKLRSYEVTVCGAPLAKYDRSFRGIVDYNDVAFCVTVKNHAIYARRNGTACWTGNSNYMLPVIATDVDQLYARFMQTIHAPDNLWTLAPLNENWVTAAKPMQDFLQLIDRRILKMYNVNKRALLEMTKLGTAIYKTHWHYEDRLVGNPNRDGAPIVRRVRSRPVVDHVRLADFLLPPSAVSPNLDEQGGAEWVGERLRLHPSTLLALAEASEPVLPNFGKDWVKLVVAHAENAQAEHMQKIRQLDYDKRANLSISFDKSSEGESAAGGGGYRVSEVELWEIHARCETQRNVWNDVVVWYHRGTRTMGREVLEDDAIVGRPYDVIRYFPGDGFYGIGVAEQLEMFQKSESDTFNFQNDNMLLGNSIGIAAKAGSMIGPGEPIYPGMVKITDGDPRAEFMPFKLGDINPGIPQTFGLLQQLGRLRSGVGDLQQGQITDLPGRTPATTVLSLMQEGSRRPDLTIKDMRYEGLSTVGTKVLQLLQAHIGRPEDTGAQTYLRFAVEALGMPEGLEVAKKLAVPLESVEMGLACALTATSASANKEVEQRRLTEMLQVTVGAADKVLGYMQLAATMPILAPAAIAAANGIKELTTRYLEQHDVRNIEAIVPAGPIPVPPPPLPAGPGVPAGADGGAGGEGGQPAGQPGGGGASSGAGQPVPAANGNAGGGPPPR